ncbi:MAG: hypothetical protein JXA20_20300 [Spirochaetes bacterium]|nr:hypothetical protein [Spirochaetota bacterium]
MPLDQAEVLRRKIRSALKEIVSRTLTVEEAVDLYRESIGHYRSLLQRADGSGDRSHLRGLLYLHNVHNMAKISAIAAKGTVPQIICHSGDRELLEPVQVLFESSDAALAPGQVHRIDDHAGMGTKHLYLCAIRPGPQTITVISATNSLYFEEERFGLLCEIIERLFGYRHAASLPWHADSVQELQTALSSIIKSGTGSRQLLLYSITRVAQVLAHTTSFELVRIHEMVHKYLMESYPQAAAVIPVSIFRYMVIAGEIAKPVTSMSFGGTIIPLTVRRLSIDEEFSLHSILWEA